jgi:D-sedoheptulose 7-phosphate isomerase
MDHQQTYRDYLEHLNKVLESVSMDELDAATLVLADAFKHDKTVFVAGNGGSAATASHMACDFCKTTLGKTPKSVERRLRSIALSDNVPLMTAYGNDVSYDDIFGEQLRTLARRGDVLVVITASGNSPNIIRVLEAAKAIGVKTIGFLGFQGGKAKEMLDHSILAESSNYGVIEDAHSVFMHMLTEHLKSVVAGGQAVTA